MSREVGSDNAAARQLEIRGLWRFRRSSPRNLPASASLWTSQAVAVVKFIQNLKRAGRDTPSEHEFAPGTAVLKSWCSLSGPLDKRKTDRGVGRSRGG